MQSYVNIYRSLHPNVFFAIAMPRMRESKKVESISKEDIPIFLNME